MTVTIRRSLVLVVALLLIVAGVFVAQKASATSATPVVYVATGENFPDALGAASAAAVQGGPVLLVQRDAIPDVTKTELNRLKPDKIIVAGGTAVVSAATFDALKAYAPVVERASGANRYSTAVEVSKSAFPVTGGGSAALEARVAALEAQVAQLESLLAGVTRDGDTLRFSGMNLQVVNGAGKTDSKNTLGNLIIGYNAQSPATPYRGGSHYLIVGDYHQYRSWGGIVAGAGHTASGPFASVTGGQFNTASGMYSSVTGGRINTASNYAAAVSGGEGNTASGYGSSISGGDYSTASGYWASVTGGHNNTTSGTRDTIVGGDGFTCDDDANYAVVCGEGALSPVDSGSS